MTLVLLLPRVAILYVRFDVSNILAAECRDPLVSRISETIETNITLPDEAIQVHTTEQTTAKREDCVPRSAKLEIRGLKT